LLRITYLGRTTFAFEDDEITLLLNPGIWDGEPIVQDDFVARVVLATNHAEDALGNAASIAVNSKAWFLGNKLTAEKASEMGVKSWLLHTLEAEVPYEIPGLRITPYSLSRVGLENGGRFENLGLYIEMGGMKVAYLGDTAIRGPFEQLETDILVTPVGGDGVFAVKDAGSLCIDAKPRIAVPMRWSSDDDPKKFSKYVEQFGKGTNAVIMQPGQVMEAHWAAGNEFRYELD
jgi:L-ascorbate metabolism protein UlaG (beta-lactamase superfamily)